MHGRFSIIEGEVPGLPPKVNAYDCLVLLYCSLQVVWHQIADLQFGCIFNLGTIRYCFDQRF